jgi:hypothetical protein
MRAHVRNLMLLGFPAVVAVTGMAMAQSTASSSPAATAVTAASPVDQPVSMNLSSSEQSARSQTFQQGKRCLELSLASEGLRNKTQLCREQALGSQGRTTCEAQTKNADIRLSSLQAHAGTAGCGQDADQTQHDFAKALVQAARAGDVDAQMCYFQWAGPLSSPGSIGRYKREANLYMSKALQRGDWRMVQLLTTPSESVAHGGAGPMGNLDIVGSWFTVYRADRLLWLGATGDYKQSLAQSAQSAAAYLKPEQIKNANTWAWQEFKRDFAHSPKLSAAPVACLNPDAQN